MKKTITAGQAVLTPFDRFMIDYNMNLLTIKVQCRSCGHIWGVKVDDYNKPADIPEKKFTCTECGYYGFGDKDEDALSVANFADSPISK